MELSTTASNFEPIILIPVQAFAAIINQLGLMLRTLVLVTAATALRISEILALQWGEIDGENQCIYVRRAYVYGKFGKPKSKASKRPVPLYPVLAAHLLNWRRETPYSKEEELVFPSFKLKGRKPRRACHHHCGRHRHAGRPKYGSWRCSAPSSLPGWI
jgi:integrase